ncbi:MAG: hypothetical protein II727_08825 [Oscillospiraceae bacterium]|nr:hypothetical protein [Oscillospiraceae bacterium]
MSKNEMKPAYFACVVVGPIIDRPRHSAPNCISGDHRRAGKKQNQNSKIVLTGNKKDSSACGLRMTEGGKAYSVLSSCAQAKNLFHFASICNYGGAEPTLQIPSPAARELNLHPQGEPLVLSILPAKPDSFTVRFPLSTVH